MATTKAKPKPAKPAGKPSANGKRGDRHKPIPSRKPLETARPEHRAMTPTARALTTRPLIIRAAASAKSRSKQDIILGLLRKPEGARIAAIMKATGWQQHSVRGFFAGIVKKKLNLNLVSEKVGDEQLYVIARALGER